ncbi:MAG: CBS domain-containing protein [Candidatus Bathyarchaeota archaeon]|nr:CBS domain-containing protein [Candidatus Bathyarchaeota archaeon]MDH5419965.1 CBS domain-containing protein [Candidatus Bathyarchaeota archaeon]MDH5623567.1 CBS domain-containing protein [Candidatus Bathyarchaeota archaeon]MDH5635980.1 CBS domain-containing protein [Candidatus Bathyarchaeota archaeon]MDH5702382.1 CBS domain-containing protein [Candidatus Bathyarchaeota archaeon]
MSLKLADVMVEDVITVEEKATIKKAVELMNKHEIGCLIVVKKGKPAGIVTERDMLKRILLESRDPEKIKVNEIMSTPLIVGKPQMDIEDAVKLMFKRNIKKLPVADKDHLVGLVTLTDLVRSEQIIKMLKQLPDKETPKRMKKVVDYFNRIISISYE